MEGPSIKLAANQLEPFKNKKVLAVSGNTKIGKERIEGQIIRDIFSWGKHLILQFTSFGLRVHFLLFGTFEAVIDGQSVTGDYKRSTTPRLKLVFENGTISMFNCSLTYIEEDSVKKTYDFTTDIMSTNWNDEKAFKKIQNEEQEEIADVLLDQTIFSGVGNIIKNEVLSIVKVNPKKLIKDISDSKLKKIIKTTYEFSQQFYEWRSKFVLKKHYTIYKKSCCPHCGSKIVRENTGKRNRRSFYCPLCQPL